MNHNPLPEALLFELIDIVTSDAELGYYSTKKRKELVAALPDNWERRVKLFFNKDYLVNTIEGFSDFCDNYKNIDPPKGLRTIIQEYVAALPEQPAYPLIEEKVKEIISFFLEFYWENNYGRYESVNQWALTPKAKRMIEGLEA